MPTTIRAPRPDELELLRDIERRAGVMFADVGLADVAAHEPESLEALTEYLRAERVWLVADAHDVPVGYALVDSVDGHAHLEQLSVLPEHGRHGLGTALVEHTCTWAEMQGYAAVTLTTFKDVPWNAPFYAKHGFAPMTPAEIGPQLRALCALEAEHGLDPDQRVCMRRPV
jgi:GNAT superfamily N-acetyltransferase